MQKSLSRQTGLRQVWPQVSQVKRDAKTSEKMLKSQLEDALAKLVKLYRLWRQ